MNWKEFEAAVDAAPEMYGPFLTKLASCVLENTDLLLAFQASQQELQEHVFYAGIDLAASHI